MPALDSVAWETCLLQPARDPEGERILRDTWGFIIPPGMRYFVQSPWLTRACAALGSQVPLLHASDNLSQMISLVVSQDNSCRYCFTATRSILRILGHSQERIRRLEEDYQSFDSDPGERAALEFARRVSRAAPLAGREDVEKLRAHGRSPAAIKEIAFLAADNSFFNRISTLPALPPAEIDFADAWYVRLLRPLLARSMRQPRAPQPAPLTPAQRVGPFAEIVNALDGLHGAARLRAVIDDAWSSTTLPRRTRALVFGVIARGIGCSLTEAEARRLLAAEGMQTPAIDHALAHLSGPDLTPLDAAAASLARESIWYQPAQIQRHARAVQGSFSAREFVDVIGTAALANMVCRLSVAVEADSAP